MYCPFSIDGGWSGYLYSICSAFNCYEAVEHFKSSADRYVQSIQIEKEIHALLRMEESLKKAESFGSRDR